MSLTDLAKLLNISKANISLWLSGGRQIPKKYAPKFKELFDVEYSKLMEEVTLLDAVKIERKKTDDEIISKRHSGDEGELMELAWKSSSLWHEERYLEIIEKVGDLLDYKKDTETTDRIFEIFDSVAEVIKLRKINLKFLEVLINTILFHKKAKGNRKDPYLFGFDRKMVGDKEIKNELKILKLIDELEDQYK